MHMWFQTTGTWQGQAKSCHASPHIPNSVTKKKKLKVSNREIRAQLSCRNWPQVYLHQSMPPRPLIVPGVLRELRICLYESCSQKSVFRRIALDILWARLCTIFRLLADGSFFIFFLRFPWTACEEEAMLQVGWESNSKIDDRKVRNC
jgi:hypothetical protein